MLQDLKLRPRYDGFVFLADAQQGIPWLATHHHPELELNLVVRGSITYVVGRHRCTFHPGELLWLYPAQPHRLVDRSRDARYYVCVFKPRLVRALCRVAPYADLRGEKPTHPGVRHAVLGPEALNLLRLNMQSLTEGIPDPLRLNREAGFGTSPDFRFEHRDPDGLNAGLRHLLLLARRCEAGASGRSGSAVPLHPAVLAALELIGRGDESALSALARRCGTSAAHLSRLFAREVGIPLTRYRQSVRLERFWTCYRQPPRKTIAEAAFAAGFGSYAQFYKVFRQLYGRGPRAGGGRSLRAVDSLAPARLAPRAACGSLPRGFPASGGPGR